MHFAAASTSASSDTIYGALPPWRTAHALLRSLLRLHMSLQASVVRPARVGGHKHPANGGPSSAFPIT